MPYTIRVYSWLQKESQVWGWDETFQFICSRITQVPIYIW